MLLSPAFFGPEKFLKNESINEITKKEKWKSISQQPLWDVRNKHQAFRLSSRKFRTHNLDVGWRRTLMLLFVRCWPGFITMYGKVNYSLSAAPHRRIVLSFRLKCRFDSAHSVKLGWFTGTWVVLFLSPQRNTFPFFYLWCRAMFKMSTADKPGCRCGPSSKQLPRTFNMTTHFYLFPLVLMYLNVYTLPLSHF